MTIMNSQGYHILLVDVLENNISGYDCCIFKVMRE